MVETGIIDGKPAIERRSCRAEVASQQKHLAGNPIGPHSKRGVTLIVGDGEKFRGQFMGCPQSPADFVLHAESGDNAKALGTITDRCAQRARPCKHALHFCCRIASGGHEGGTERETQS